MNDIARVKGGDLSLSEILEHRLTNNDFSHSSLINIRSRYSNHIEPYFKNKHIREITVPELLDYRTYLLETIKSRRTASIILSLLKTIFKHAEIYFDLSENHTRKVPSIKFQKKHINPIEIDVFYDKVENIENTTFKYLTILLFNTGLRIGEALALNWNDVDFRNNRISISKNKRSSDGVIEHKTKTSESTNLVPFPNRLKFILKEMYEEQKSDYEYFSDDYFIFGGLKDVSTETFTYNFKKAFPDKRVHDLRHSYASHLANKGVDIATLKELLRHTNITTTINTYTHIYDEKKSDAMKHLDF